MNGKSLLSKEALREVLGDVKVDNINVWELMGRCKEYLLDHNINVITDINPNKNNEERWTAIAIKKREFMSHYFLMDSTSNMLFRVKAETEYEAMFKITNMAIKIEGEYNDNYVAIMEQMKREELSSLIK